MTPRNAFLLIALLCLPFLTGCMTMSAAMARLNEIRLELMTKIEKEITAAKLEPGSPGFIRIFKEEARLELWMRDTETGKYRLYKTYPICKYSGKLGPKLQEGDMQSPEGFYDVSEEWLWPASDYHLAMNIGFPNTYDQAHGRTGTLLMVHGGCESEGCYAMTDPNIEEIYLLVEQSLKNGQKAVPVHIFPFRMTNENMSEHSYSRWMPFWKNLKQGYDAFERTRIPPTVHVKNDLYAFEVQVYVRRGGA